MLNLDEKKSEVIPLLADETGRVLVTGSRVTLLTLITAFQQGATPEQIVQEYGELKLGDVYAVVTYYLRHREDVDSYLAKEREEEERIREETERRFPAPGIRERLLRRREELFLPLR